MFWLARTGARLTGADAGAGNGVVLIDSGHGGSDPGKIGIHQEKEKDINLQIAKRLKKQLEKNGVKVYMTRENDVDLSEGDGGNSKVQDLKRRCEMVRKIQPDCVLSIHQNSYPEEAIHGAQVFYYEDSSEGKKLAEILQKHLVEVLDKENHKFQYKEVERGGRAQKYFSSIEWLLRADMVHLCKRVTDVRFDLDDYAREDFFRVYTTDLSLLMAMKDFSLKQHIVENTLFGNSKGGIYECALSLIHI